jgi:hypothetical protein
LFAGRQQSIDSQEDCRKRLETLRVQSDSNRFSRRADRNNKMATKCYRVLEGKTQS